MLSSSLRMYLCSINHSICSLIIFFDGRNMFLRMSTSSDCSCALDMRLRILRILMMASCVRRMRSWMMPSLSSSRVFSVLSCKRPMRFSFPRFWSFPFFNIPKLEAQKDEFQFLVVDQYQMAFTSLPMVDAEKGGVIELCRLWYCRLVDK